MTAYPKPFADLWAIERLPALGPGSANESARAALAAISVDMFPNVRNAEAANACISGLWLYHDFLDESQTISQDLPSWFGSYWHGIMHRREPDASNSKYWFRRVPPNPVFEAMGPISEELGLTLPRTAWDPYRFVDLCESNRGAGTPQELLLRKVQLREMKELFNCCFKLATT